MRHQLSRVVNQIPQHHERLERQWYSFIRSALPFAPETFVDEIKPKWGECLICHPYLKSRVPTPSPHFPKKTFSKPNTNLNKTTLSLGSVKFL